ncbi:DNA-binding helix-turn-helix protein [Leptospira kirschneri str. 200801774]|uniref:helix-turn-helix domain-containing protein n=1 Tax=Leptospira kirschneri TaxID=29507 RepID=UPI0002BEE31D|nr:helix-turn-helix transcriptional regulator [Leptospira kirschneri]EMO78556.1 DNA-binding helix-turn-helix protein [Leptospira kirschneri str. 200801774]
MSRKEVIIKAIDRRKACLQTADLDRELLINFIREFAEAKRGNQTTLSKATGVPTSTISNLVKDTGFPPGIEIIIVLAEAIVKLETL